MLILTVAVVLALVAAGYGARELWKRGKSSSIKTVTRHHYCSICGGIIPPGWPVSYDGTSIAHRFRTQCQTKDPK